MTTRTITIREEVYWQLVKIKREDESFSDLLERLTRSVNPLQLLHEMRGSFELGDTEDLLQEIAEKRRNFR